MGVNIGNLSDAITRELGIYSTAVTDRVKQEAKNSMDKLVKTTKATAPVGHRKKHYKSNISSRKAEETDRKITYQWYVKGNDYRLSHLLENGHANRDGGRTEGTGFIAAATTPVLEEYEKKVEEAVKNG